MTAVSEPYFAAELERLGIKTEVIEIAASTAKARLLKSLFYPVRLRRYDIIVMSEYMSAWAFGLRLMTMRKRPACIVIGLNQSSKLLKTRWRSCNELIDRVWKTFLLVVVHSRAERDIFAQTHGIRPNKLKFIPWGFDLPSVSSNRFDTWPRPFICSIGRNNRDFDTLCEAAEGLPVDVILVGPRSLGQDDSEPTRNVYRFSDLSMEDCLSCIRRSIVNVLLVNDGNRGAGHITAVAAMLLAKPQIFSDVPTLTDYLKDGFNGIAVPVRSAHSVRRAISRLLEDRDLAKRLGDRGFEFASSDLSSNAVAKETAMAICNSVAHFRRIDGQT